MFSIERRYQVLILLLLAGLLFGGGVKYAQHFLNPSGTVVIEANGLTGNQAMPTSSSNSESVSAGKSVTTGDPELVPSLIYVHVVGAVEKPGYYQLPAGSRVFEAVEKAIPLPGADLQAINLARILSDEQQIYVPKAGEFAAGVPVGVNGGTGASSATALNASSSLGTAGGSTGKVNLNTASVQELDAQLPGIGPTLAQRIVDYRQQHGGFRSIEDIKNVSGIGEKRYAELKDRLTVH